MILERNNHTRLDWSLLVPAYLMGRTRTSTLQVLRQLRKSSRREPGDRAAVEILLVMAGWHRVRAGNGRTVWVQS